MLYTYNNMGIGNFLNGSATWQGWLSKALDGRQSLSPITLLNSFLLYSNASGWVTEMAVFGQVRMLGCYTVVASPSPSPLPSAVPTVAPITANMTASFSQEGPAMHLSTHNSSATVAMSTNLSAMLVGGTTMPTSGQPSPWCSLSHS
jgi:hypothetical protein